MPIKNRAKTLQKRQKFKKFITNFEFKNFSQITSIPTPRPPKTNNPFCQAKSAESLAIHHLFFEIKGSFLSQFHTITPTHRTHQPKNTKNLGKKLRNRTSPPHMPPKKSPCSPARRYAARAGRGGSRGAQGGIGKNVLSVLLPMPISKNGQNTYIIHRNFPPTFF